MKLSSLNFIESIAPISLRGFIKRQAKRLLGLFLILFAGLLTLSIFSWSPFDPNLNNLNGNFTVNALGITGAIVSDLLLQILGISSILLIFMIAKIGFDLTIQRNIVKGIPNYILYPLYLVLFSIALSSMDITKNTLFLEYTGWTYLVGGGGVFGDIMVKFLQEIISINMNIPDIDSQRKILFLCSIFIISIFYIFNFQIKKYKKRKAIKLIESEDFYTSASSEVSQKNNPLKAFIKKILLYAVSIFKSLTASNRDEELSFEEIREAAEENTLDEDIVIGEKFEENYDNNFSDAPIKKKKLTKKVLVGENLDLFNKTKYVLPSLSLLSNNTYQNISGQLSELELEDKAEALSKVLLEYKVNGNITNIRPGPVVCLYELEPSPGTKASRVIGLADDIAMSMEAISARVAVIPGRNLIGIELPLEDRSMVYLREILDSSEFNDTSHKLAIALGKNIGGQPVVVDLANMPHLLIAGTTGSGKSVGINTMILSLIYKYSPDDCKLIMIDPKMLELSIYDGIPHLLSPVVTEPKKAVTALKWVVKEMERRYKCISKVGVRNLDGYNKKIEKEGGVIKNKVQVGFEEKTGKPNYHDEEIVLKKMPYIVIVVDEMADLMAVAGKEIEMSVQRIAQMARAAGIHLIMATQRPSTDVITGVIKANFPTRISFQVSSKIDSRVILGESGAEQLLGKGDMLYMSDGGRINRIHGAFVDDDEVVNVVNFLTEQANPEYNEDIVKDEDEISQNSNPIDNKIEEDIYQKAIDVVVSDQKASTSYIQRRLGIGYNKAANIIEQMEQDGIISHADHVGRREILLNEQNFDKMS
tara:strand:- start:7866 stop:10316 length:2451 start_codon:yes stop_codon:yes gene_type:complete